MQFKKTPTSETVRISGDRLRLESFLRSYTENPKYRLEVHESLQKVRAGCYTAFVTVHLVPSGVGK